MCRGEKIQGWTSLIAVFIIRFPFICHSQTSLQIIDSLLHVEATLGENMTIPCVLTAKRQPQRVLNLDLSTDSVRWDMKSLNGSIHKVCLFTKGINKLNIQRSNIEGKEFKRGHASLTMYNVQGSDEGEYICNVFVAGKKLSAVRTVEVSARPVVTLSSYDVTIDRGNEQSVTCYVRKFYPESVNIRWEKRSASSEILALNEETCTRVPKEAEDGTFNVTSLMTVRPSSIYEDGDKYSCIVSHRSLKSERAAHFTVTVKEPHSNYNLFLGISIGIALLFLVGAAVALYFIRFKKRPPKISDIAGIDDLAHEKSSTVSWTVSDFRPKNIDINAYLERGDRKEKIGSWKYPLPQSQKNDTVDGEREEFMLSERQNAIQPLTPKSSSFSYSCLCSINITPDKSKDKEAELVIEVIHGALKSTLTERHKLNIKGDFFRSQIIAPHCLKHGEEVTLTCDITKCDTGPLSITWLKGKKVIYKDGGKKDTRYSYSETPEEPYGGNVLKSSRSLTFRLQVKEDHGMIYTCRVYYRKINKVLVPKLETSVTAQPVVEQIIPKHVGQQMELSCRIHSFHPKTIDIKWFKEDEELPTTDSELSIGEDYLYSTTSILKYTPKPKDIGKTFWCKVDHQSLRNPETREWKSEEQKGNGIKS